MPILNCLESQNWIVLNLERYPIPISTEDMKENI